MRSSCTGRQVGRSGLRNNKQRGFRTPHLDRLGHEGIVFERAYCAGPHCVPARAALVSGYCAYDARRFERFAVRDQAAIVPAQFPAFHVQEYMLV